MSWPQSALYIVLPAVAYLLGSIPFGLLIGLAKGIDIRKAGSGNIGATNLGRLAGRRYFFYAFALDAAKGFVPTLAASVLTHRLNLPDYAPLFTAVAAVVGHLFPLYLRFKGGKGVATSFGAVLGIWPIYTLAGLVGLVSFIVVLMVWRYISLASIVGALAFTGAVVYFGTSRWAWLHTTWPELQPLVYTALAFALMIILKHRGNIGRLLKGTEPKVGTKPRP
jgi:glycerol-3-phosphate acyltransferase PlsY